MARRKSNMGGGLPGGGGRMSNQAAIIKQVQQMQEEMARTQAALEEETVTASVGGGAITIEITGAQQVKAITINPDVIDTDDDEWITDLQDLLLAAFNQAVEQSKQHAEERMQSVTGGLDSMLPGGLGGLLG